VRGTDSRHGQLIADVNGRSSTCSTQTACMLCCSMADREKSLQNAINAMYRFDSDLKDLSLWLTKVDVVLGRYAEVMSGPAGLDSTQRGQINDSLRARAVLQSFLKLEWLPFSTCRLSWRHYVFELLVCLCVRATGF